MSIRSGRRGWVMAGLLLWMLGIALTPLTESTEGRYASVGAEMARSGNWLEPTYSGLPHYTKPPWAYWAVAASLSVFPETEWAARLPAMIAAWMVLFWAVAIARARGADDDEVGRLQLMLVASPILLGQARLPSGDIHLAAAVLAVYWAVLADTRGGVLRTVVAAGGFAVGILAKGHIILLWTLLPLLIWGLRHPRDHARSLRVVLLGLGLGVLLALPWFLAARNAHPSIVDYWLGSETADRVLSNSHHRSEPWWYYLVLLPLTLLPWLPEAVLAFLRSLRERAASSLVLLGVILPMVVLQLSVSKRPNYVLPAVLLLAILSARYPVRRWWKQRCVGAIGLLLVAPLLLMGRPEAWPSTKRLAAAIDSSAGTVLVHHELPSSLPFYLGRPVATLAVDRETRFATAEQRSRYDADDWVLAERLRAGDVVLSPTHKRPQITEALEGLRWRLRATIDHWELIEIEGTR